LSGSLFIKNQQRTFPINVRHLRWLTRELLVELLWVEDFDLAIYLVRAPRMAQLNNTFLQHQGPTDVITLDYADPLSRVPPPAPQLHGEIFVCLDEAMNHARQFHTTWQSEVVRYIVHGILHLRGHNDQEPSARRKMKREEDRLLRQIVLRFPLNKLTGK
jgi:probable rRNA maturation factor